MAEGLRLEDWIGKRVTVNILMRPKDDPEDEEVEEVVGIAGFWRV